MRQIALLFFTTMLLLACKKENKEPECRFSKMTNAGSTTKLSVTYSGDSLVTVGENYPGYKLYFNKQKRVIRRDEPVADPYYRSEMEYNSNGQVTELRFYTKQGSSWVDEGKLVFTYDNGKMVNVREENTVSQIGNLYDHQIVWQGNNIQAVMHRLNQQTICTTQFSYDGAKPNPMGRFSYFYFCDGNANYSYYKLPYYFSEQLVTKQESSCPLSETRLFNYSFTSNGLIESISDQAGSATGVIWEYEYECR